MTYINIDSKNIQIISRQFLTINSDDVLIFDSDVSKEYLQLYEAQCLTAEELENIRKNGLKPAML